MKVEISLQKLLAQGDLQAVDTKAKNDRKLIDDTKTFLSLPYYRQYIYTVVY